MANPSIPPQVAPHFPSDPFEAWLAQQALAGHDRMWLARNSTVLRQRWQRDPNSPLPPPPPPNAQRAPDRYSEV